MDIDIIDGDDIHLGSHNQDARQAPKVILLEFALVRRGSHRDLPCEEAPEACACLEPLPTPRGQPHLQHRHVQYGGPMNILQASSRECQQTLDLSPPAGIVVCPRENEEEARCYWKSQHSKATARPGKAS